MKWFSYKFSLVQFVHISPTVRVCDIVERGAQNIMMFSKSVFHADSASADCQIGTLGENFYTHSIAEHISYNPIFITRYPIEKTNVCQMLEV